MGQLVNHTSFQFNGTVVETFSVAIVFSFFEVFGFEIFVLTALLLVFLAIDVLLLAELVLM